MTKWEYCEFQYSFTTTLTGKINTKFGKLTYFTKNGEVVEDLGAEVDRGKVIAQLGEAGFELVQGHQGAYLFKRPISGS